MGDCATIVLAGNLDGAVEIGQRDGQTVAIARVGIGQTAFVQGQMQAATLWLQLEVRGSSGAYAFAGTYAHGSRVVCQGHLVPPVDGQVRVVVDQLLGTGGS